MFDCLLGDEELLYWITVRSLQILQKLLFPPKGSEFVAMKSLEVDGSFLKEMSGIKHGLINLHSPQPS